MVNEVNDVVRVEPTETGAVDSDWHSTMDTAFRRFDTLHQNTHCDVLFYHGEAFAVDIDMNRVRFLLDITNGARDLRSISLTPLLVFAHAILGRHVAWCVFINTYGGMITISPPSPPP